MIKSAEMAAPDSCLNKAFDDEPVFVLRAHDPGSADAVRFWADSYMKRKSPLNLRETAKYDEALNLANEMELWRRTAARQGRA